MSRLRPLVNRLRQFQGLAEIGSVLVLSLATVASAWCGYQSALWSGIQTFALHEADRLERAAAQREVRADQLRMVDAALFVQYALARARGEEQFAKYLLQRFRPEARTAMEAWLATRPMTQTGAPSHPFVMPEYRLVPEAQAQEIRRRADKQEAAAKQANTISDTYVLLTVLFTTVLFFTGICTKLPGQLMQAATLSLGVVLFVVGVVALLRFPVAGL